MAPSADSPSADEDWLGSYLSTGQARANELGGVKNGRRLSTSQQKVNLRRRSWACPRESLEKITASAVVVPENISMPTQRLSQELGVGSRRTSVSAEYMSDIVFVEKHSADGKGKPMFKNWNDGNQEYGVDMKPRPPRRGSLDFGDLEAVRARLVQATDAWAAEERERDERALSEAIKTATSKAAASKVIEYQKREATTSAKDIKARLEAEAAGEAGVKGQKKSKKGWLARWFKSPSSQKLVFQTSFSKPEKTWN